MKKIMFLSVICLYLFYSCSNNNKKNCKISKDKKSEICWDKDSVCRIESSLNTGKIKEIYSDKKMSAFALIVFKDNNTRLLDKLVLRDSKGVYETIVYFSENGRIESVFQENLGTKETLELRKDGKGNRINVHQLNNGSLIQTATLYIDNKGDTSNYFYYNKVPNGFRLVTDFEEFKLNSDLTDKLEIIYSTENLLKLQFLKDDGIYFPDFGTRKTIQLFNKHYLSSTSNELVGELWGEYKSDSSYAYRPLIFKGDLLKRISDFMVTSDHLENQIFGELVKNTDILSELIELKLFKLENGELKLK